MNAPILHFISPPVPYFIDCGRSFYNSGERHLKRYKIGFFDLIIVAKGALLLGEGTQEWVVQEGESLILRPDDHHFGTGPCLEETEIIWIHFNTFGAWAEYSEVAKCLENQSFLTYQHRQTAHLSHSDVSSIFIPKYTKLSQKAMDILNEFFQLDQEPRSVRNWRRQSVFQLFMQHLDRELALTPDLTAIQLAEKIELFIRINFTKKITNSVLQKELNYHSNYLAKCMHKVYGMTPVQYLVQYRIEQAKKLLIQTKWSLVRIAEEVGFHDGSYFSSCFSKIEGVSPLNFRKNYTRHS